MPTTHRILPEVRTLHGHFSRELPPAFTIDSGDVVRFTTLDVGWSLVEQPDPFAEPVKFQPRDMQRDPGHSLCGPVEVRGAEPGMTLEIELRKIVVGGWGWTRAGGFPSPLNQRLGLADPPEYLIRWKLDAERGVGTSNAGHRVRLRPFMGILGMPPAEPGRHSTIPPRPCGGNIDCKELVQGSTLWLPIAVPGALFSTGDGHAAQGDGEVAGPALECPMADVEIALRVLPDVRLTMPRARTPAGRVTFGFDTDLDVAMAQALDGMLAWMGEEFGFERKEALALASLTVDLHVTQVVNGVCGVHAILPDGAIERAS